MTPERKKKLRTLLRKKAAEELKKEQERKAEERLRVIAERCGTKADLDSASMDDLKKICQVCLCQPAEAVQGLSPPSSVTMTDSIQEGRWLCLSDHRWMILFSFVIAMFS